MVVQDEMAGGWGSGGEPCGQEVEEESRLRAEE